MTGTVVTADVIIQYPDGGIVLIKRGKDPFRGSWALPGGILEGGETVEQCAVREAKEETGVSIRLKKLVGVFSEPGRDPRGHYVTIVFLAEPVDGSPQASSDAADLIITKDFRDLPLAFDHAKVLRAAFPEGA
ncbi:MAG: NUDIX domain-containing protein [Candidatus Methylomirabilales bacterium]